MLVDGFDSDPMVMMTVQPALLPGADGAGGAAQGQGSVRVPQQRQHASRSEKIERVAERALAANGVRVRPIDMKNFDADVERVWQVYNSAWERNWGFVPMSREEFACMGKEMKQILKPELVLIGEVQGQRGGFRAGPARHQPGAETGGREAVPHGFAQNTVLSTFDQKCAGPGTGGSGGVPRFRGWRRAFMPRWSATPGSWATATARCPGYWKTTYS